MQSRFGFLVAGLLPSSIAAAGPIASIPGPVDAEGKAGPPSTLARPIDRPRRAGSCRTLGERCQFVWRSAQILAIAKVLVAALKRLLLDKPSAGLVPVLWVIDTLKVSA
jgi:hypothetical protein